MGINNKGMTLVELIITFALVLVIVVGLYNLILEVKFQMEEKQESRDLTQFSANVNNDIHYNLLANRNNITEIYIESSDATASASGCRRGSCTESQQLVKTLCENNNINECVVYCYNDDAGSSKCRVVGLNVGNSESVDPLTRNGVYYGEADSSKAIFEPVPIENKYIFSQYGTSSTPVSIDADTRIYINYDSNKNLIINYPLFLLDDTNFSHNYGFKIVVPLEG